MHDKIVKLAFHLRSTASKVSMMNEHACSLQPISSVGPTVRQPITSSALLVLLMALRCQGPLSFSFCLDLPPGSLMSLNKVEPT